MLAIDLVDLLPVDVAASVREVAQRESCSELDALARGWRDYAALLALGLGARGFLNGGAVSVEVVEPCAGNATVMPPTRPDWTAPANIEEAVIGVVLLDRVERLPDIKDAVQKRYGWTICTKTIDTTCARLARRGELERFGVGQYRTAA